MERPPRRPQDGVLSATALVLICTQVSTLIPRPCSGVWPYNRTAFIMHAALVQGLAIAGMTLAVYASALAVEGYTIEAARSLALVFMTTQQLVLVFCTQSLTLSLVRTGVLGNRWLLGAFLLSTALLCAGDYIPGVNAFLNLTPLSAIDWAKVAVGGVLIVVVNEVLKGILQLPWATVCSRCCSGRRRATSTGLERHAPLLSPTTSSLSESDIESV